MKVIEAPVYRSDDGLREFKSQDECIEYEKFILLRAIIHKHARGIVYQAEVANFILKAWSEISLAMQHNGEARAIESAAQPALAAVPLTDEKIDHTLATTLDEFARTTRGMSHALDVNADITANSRLRRMFARAVLAAQPADAQPTGQSPCARHCEAPAFEGEIRRLKREATIKDSLTIRPPAPAAVPPGWLPIESAPKNGTDVLLLIEGGEHTLQDDTPKSISIGAYGVIGGPDDGPVWTFAGWSWQQDCYCQGTGTPTHWMPLPPLPGIAAAGDKP